MNRLINSSQPQSNRTAHKHHRISRVQSHVIVQRIPSRSNNPSPLKTKLQQKQQSDSVVNLSAKEDIIQSRIDTRTATACAWANTTDYQTKKKKKSIVTKKGAIIFSILMIIVCIIITVILLLLLIKPKQSKLSKSNIINPVLRWNPVGQTIAGLSGINGLNGSQLDNPWGLALTYDLTLYIADRFNDRIQKYKRDSSIGETLPGLSSSTLYRPANIILDSNENLYIADGFNHRVQFWDRSTNLSKTIAGTGAAGNAINQLDYPYGIARDFNSDLLYIADHNNHRIMTYQLNTNSCCILVNDNNTVGLNNTQLNTPISVYFDSLTPSLYVSDLGGNQILQWIFKLNRWKIIAGNTFGTSGNDSISLNGPLGFTFDPMGNLYVADLFNNRIQLFYINQLNGTTIAGVTGEIGTNNTFLNYPYDIILDSQLNLYVSDNQNHRVQKFLRY